MPKSKQESPEGRYQKIKKTLDLFLKNPYSLVFLYRSSSWYRLFFSENKIDVELYPILRIIYQLGGRQCIEALRKHCTEENPANPDEKITALCKNFRHAFDNIYQPNVGYVAGLNKDDRKDKKKKIKLLRLMPEFKKRINRFVRKINRFADKDAKKEVIFFNHETIDGKLKPEHQKKIEEEKLPAYSWLGKDKTQEQAVYFHSQAQVRNTKKTLVPIAKFFAGLVATGQAVIGAYAVYKFIIGIAFFANPVWAPLLTSIALVSALGANYILFRGRTIKTFVQFFKDGPFAGLDTVLEKIAAIFVLLSSLAAGFLMGAIAWIGCMTLAPILPIPLAVASPLALGIGLVLMAANLFAYTSLMYVSGMKMLKKISAKANRTYWKEGWKELTKEWEPGKRLETSIRWTLNLLLFASGMTFLLFSLVSLLTSWHINTFNFFTDTLPPALQLSAEIAQTTSLTLVLGFAAIARAAFTFDAILSLVEFTSEKLMDVGHWVKEKCEHVLAEESNEAISQEDGFKVSDLWNDPLNTTLRFAETLGKGLLLVCNALGFAALAIMGYERLSLLGLNNVLLAKIGSFGSTALVSGGCNNQAMQESSDHRPGSVPDIFKSPVSQPNDRDVPEVNGSEGNPNKSQIRETREEEMNPDFLNQQGAPFTAERERSRTVAV